MHGLNLLINSLCHQEWHGQADKTGKQEGELSCWFSISPLSSQSGVSSESKHLARASLVLKHCVCSAVAIFLDIIKLLCLSLVETS